MRFGQLTSVAMVLANKRLRDLGIVDECGAPAFMQAADPGFSDEFKDQAGTYLWDGPAVNFERWRAETMKIVQIIDQDEHLDYWGNPVESGR